VGSLETTAKYIELEMMTQAIVHMYSFSVRLCLAGPQIVEPSVIEYMPDTILTPWKPDRVHANLIMALEDEAFPSLVHCWSRKCSSPFLLLV
jgi:hypothetical protein